MLDKKHIVDIPEGAIVKKDRTVLWTIEKKDPNIPDEIKKYVHLREGRGPKSIVIEKETIQSAINDDGFYGLATSEKMTAEEAYKIYQMRDSSEKQYMFMKSTYQK